eukprot:g40761.t1
MIIAQVSLKQCHKLRENHTVWARRVGRPDGFSIQPESVAAVIVNCNQPPGVSGRCSDRQSQSAAVTRDSPYPARAGRSVTVPRRLAIANFSFTTQSDSESWHGCRTRRATASIVIQYNNQGAGGSAAATVRHSVAATKSDCSRRTVLEFKSMTQWRYHPSYPGYHRAIVSANQSIKWSVKMSRTVQARWRLKLQVDAGYCTCREVRRRKRSFSSLSSS